MGPYRPVAYQGARVVTVHHRPSQMALGQTFDQMLGLPAYSGDVVRLIFHTGATIIGVHVGLRGKGGMAALGWIVAIGQGFAGLLDLVSLYKRASGTHPPE